MKWTMKQVMRFNLWGNTVAVYFVEERDCFQIFQIIGKKKLFVDNAEGASEAAEIALNFCYENAC